jgi:hypothetical protein
MKQGLAGTAVGKDSDIVVLVGDGEPTDLKITNRWVYVKKCLLTEKDKGIILTDLTRANNVFALVLGISKDCGKWHKLTAEQKKRGELPSVIVDIHPQSKVVLPDNHPWGIKRSPYGEDEFFVREDIIKAVLEE